MSHDAEDPMSMTPQPLLEHAWLGNLVGTWATEAEMTMPDGTLYRSEGIETVEWFGSLWVLARGTSHIEGGAMRHQLGLGYDVSFHEYRGFYVSEMSSHLWKYTGELSEDGKTMTLHCVGPNMMQEGEMANYRDVIHLVDENHRTMVSSAETEPGEWTTFMTVRLTRVIEAG